jgi:hypothetical protein
MRFCVYPSGSMENHSLCPCLWILLTSSYQKIFQLQEKRFSKNILPQEKIKISKKNNPELHPHKKILKNTYLQKEVIGISPAQIIGLAAQKEILLPKIAKHELRL